MFHLKPPLERLISQAAFTALARIPPLIRSITRVIERAKFAEFSERGKHEGETDKERDRERKNEEPRIARGIASQIAPLPRISIHSSAHKATPRRARHDPLRARYCSSSRSDFPSQRQSPVYRQYPIYIGWRRGRLHRYRCLNKQDVNSPCCAPGSRQVIRRVVAGLGALNSRFSYRGHCFLPSPLAPCDPAFSSIFSGGYTSDHHHHRRRRPQLGPRPRSSA